MVCDLNQEYQRVIQTGTPDSFDFISKMAACHAEHGLHGVGQRAGVTRLELPAVIKRGIIIFLKESDYFTAAQEHCTGAENSFAIIGDSVVVA